MRFFTILTQAGEVYSAPSPKQAGDIIIPDRPGPEYVINLETRGWELDMAAIKQNAIERIKEKRLLVEYAGPEIEVDGEKIRFPANIKDETRLNSLVSIFEAHPEMIIEDWKVADGVYVTMSAGLLSKIKEAVFLRAAETFSVERKKQQQVQEVEDSAEAVNDWLAAELETGWPV